MYGLAFLVAPITDQGATSRKVYVPSESDWYNYWTHEKVKGGQTTTVQAPIDTLPLFVRAGSIVPVGEPIESTSQTQAIAKLQVWPGANATFMLYDDDGTTYAYEKGNSKISKLSWDDTAQKMSYSGAPVWSASKSEIIEVIGR